MADFFKMPIEYKICVDFLFLIVYGFEAFYFLLLSFIESDGGEFFVCLFFNKIMIFYGEFEFLQFLHSEISK